MGAELYRFQYPSKLLDMGSDLKEIYGEEDRMASLADTLLYVMGAVTILAVKLGDEDDIYMDLSGQYIVDALFCRISNINADNVSLSRRIITGLGLRDKLKETICRKGIPVPGIDCLTWYGNTEADFLRKSSMIAIHSSYDQEIRSLEQLVVCGLEGLAVHLEHARLLGRKDAGIISFIFRALSGIAMGLTKKELIGLVLETGRFGIRVIDMLDKAVESTYGQPQITSVNIGVGKNPGILVSGNDLNELEELLDQTLGTGVDVYTHSEMLPAHYFPAFKKYPHLVGNYGNASWRQNAEFILFNGPIYLTSNCALPTLSSVFYKGRIYTGNTSGLPGCHKVLAGADGRKDFSEIIAQAIDLPAPIEIENGTIVSGFAHNQILALSDKLVAGLKTGSIHEFYVMSGYDGTPEGRNYYLEFIKTLPKDIVILTMGCYKQNNVKLALGDINGVPRVLDAGKCNGSYLLAIIAMRLKEILVSNDLNELPITYKISWYDRKSIIVLLALVSLGVKNIHLWPEDPDFMSAGVMEVLSRYILCQRSSIL